MTVRYIPGGQDLWLVNSAGTNWGNGAGPRLQVGRKVVGADTWINRIGLEFPDPISAGTETVTSVVLRLKVRGTHACITNVAAPDLYIERVAAVTDVWNDNSATDECGFSSAGTALLSLYPGLTTTVTNRVSWSPGAFATDDVLSVDVTALWNAWWAVRSFVPAVAAGDARLNFNLVIKSQNEAASGNNVAFYARNAAGSSISEGGTGPDLVFTYSTNRPPATPSVALTPNAVTLLGTATVVFNFDFNDPDGEQCYQCLVQVSTDNTFASVTHWNPAFSAPTTASAGRATENYGGSALTRGVQYYWRVKVRDAALAESAYSAVKSFKLNSLPTVTGRVPA